MLLKIIQPILIVVNKILRIILHVKQNYHNVPEIGTHELYRTLYVHTVYNYNLLKFIRSVMNDRTQLFEEFHEQYLSYQNYDE